MAHKSARRILLTQCTAASLSMPHFPGKFTATEKIYTLCRAESIMSDFE